ncbi:hypothetical protein BT93_F2879 [Corymbia citriodora subsp. variegata]|nr:hypothetical protein BT93_F2879 [Corymbia citriodora subsp. variegata]
MSSSLLNRGEFPSTFDDLEPSSSQFSSSVEVPYILSSVMRRYSFKVRGMLGTVCERFQ